jgi:outer membrane protein assembly factor BamB
MEEKQEQWHRFRGPGGAGVSVYTNIPTNWDGKTGENILWKTKVPLPGRNSPVVWKDRVFLSGADPNARQVYCFDAADGKLLWRGDVPTPPLPEGQELQLMEDTGYAASTVATDGHRVYAIFPTGDVAGFDFNGRRVWHRNLGLPDNVYGYATSLETYENLVVIQYDQGDGMDGRSRIYALDGLSGRSVWEAKRALPNSWTSPIVVDVEGQHQLVTLADPCAVAYDPADGREIWWAECVTGDVAGSPIYAGGLILLIEPYAQLLAVNPTGQGDVTETLIVWRMEEAGPDICSPVASDRYVYLLESEGYLVCCKLADGEKVYEHDLRERFTASPSIAGDKLYLLDAKGVMHIGGLGDTYEEVAVCPLGEACYASPAFVDGRIYIRGDKHLYCIGQSP